MNLTSWDAYIDSAPVNRESFQRCHAECHSALGRQREFVRELLGLRNPRRVACLGAGYLNDIPVEELLRGGADVYLVDWVREIAPRGFRWGLIGERAGIYSCLACSQGTDGARYCGAFALPMRPPHTVCANFTPAGKDPVWCGRYRPGPQPRFTTGDITGGRAEFFARRITPWVARSSSPEQALRHASNLVRQAAQVFDPIDIPSHSIDLVTSSMVLSQFDEEPFSFFVHRLRERFGSEMLARRARHLEPPLERVRSDLFAALVEGHAKQLKRLVNGGGQVFLAVEWFRTVEGGDECFLVEKTAQALNILGKSFLFDFGTIPTENSMTWVPLGEGRSIVGNHVMRPFPRNEPDEA